jgi:hypothetical protein
MRFKRPLKNPPVNTLETPYRERCEFAECGRREINVVCATTGALVDNFDHNSTPIV